MKKYIFALLAYGVAGLALADGDMTRTGTMRIGTESERTAALHIGCSSDRHGGALAIELTVSQATTKKDFGYDDFEGPDAPPGKLSRLDWTSNKGKTSIAAQASGSYIPEPPDAFVFAIDVLSGRHSAAATLLANFGNAPGTLVWTQSSHDTSRRELVATFEFDAAQAQHVHDITAACLPK